MARFEYCHIAMCAALLTSLASRRQATSAAVLVARQRFRTVSR